MTPDELKEECAVRILKQYLVDNPYHKLSPRQFHAVKLSLKSRINYIVNNSDRHYDDIDPDRLNIPDVIDSIKNSGEFNPNNF